MSLMLNVIMLSVIYAERRLSSVLIIFNVVMLTVVLLTVVMLTVVLLTVVMLTVVMLTVVMLSGVMLTVVQVECQLFCLSLCRVWRRQLRGL